MITEVKAITIEPGVFIFHSFAIEKDPFYHSAKKLPGIPGSILRPENKANFAFLQYRVRGRGETNAESVLGMIKISLCLYNYK